MALDSGSPCRNDGVLAIMRIATTKPDHLTTEDVSANQLCAAHFSDCFALMPQACAFCKVLYQGNEAVNFIYLEVNPAFAKLTGLQDVIGKRATDVIPGSFHSNPQLLALLGKVALTQGSQTLESYIAALDMTVSVMVFSPLPEHFIAIFDKVTPKAKTDFADDANEVFYASVFHNSPLGIVISRPDSGIIVNANESFLAMHGLTRLEALGRSSLALGIWAYPEQREEMLNAIAGTGRIKNYRMTFRRKSGTTGVALVSAELMELNGQTFLLGTLSDISELILLEEERSQLAEIIEKTSDMVSIADREGRIRYMNLAGRRMLGLSPDEDLTDASIFKFHPEWSYRMVSGQGIPHAVRYGSWAGNTALVNQDGIEFPISLVIIGHESQGSKEIDLISTIARDMSEQVSEEKARKEAYALLRTFFDSATVGMAYHDRQLRFLRINKVLADLNGKPIDDHLGLTISEVLPELSEHLLPFFHQVLSKGEIISNQQIRAPMPSDPERMGDWLVSYYPVRDKSGEILGIGVIVLEVTELKEAERKLRASEERYRLIVQSSHEGIVALDTRHRITFVNPAMVELLGYAPEEMLGKPIDEFIVEEELSDHWKRISAANHEKFERYERRLRRKDGSECIFVFSVASLRDGQGQLLGSFVFLYNITHLRKAEKEMRLIENQLMQNQKMEALGQLTGGIAHDFNNLLAAILGFAELAAKRHANDTDGKLSEYLGEIIRAGERGRDLVLKMMDYSRNRPDRQPPIIKPQHAVQDMLKMLASTLPANMELISQIDADAPPLKIEPIDLYQMLVNLVINARDAIGVHGRIEVCLKRIYKPPSQCTICLGYIEGIYAALEVADNGEGIPKESFSKIFDPFYTTKEVGKGSGLGLSIVLSILHRVGGHIEVESELGKGTQFRLLLPESLEPVVDKAAQVNAQHTNLAWQPGGRVWVVDDELAIVRYLSELLEKEGYSVTGFSDSLSALRSFWANPDSVDCVVTDQAMPRLTGLELASAIAEVRQDLPVILCTGYGEGLDEADLQALGINACLRKPINTDALFTTLECVLKESREGLT